MNHQKTVEFIRQYISNEGAAMMVAEECSELAQMMCKVPRVSGGVFNPTPMNEYQLKDKIEEEITDLMNALWIAGYDPMRLLTMVMSDDNSKLQRCAARIREELREKREAEKD